MLITCPALWSPCQCSSPAQPSGPPADAHQLLSPPVPLPMLITCPALWPLPSGLRPAEPHLQQHHWPSPLAPADAHHRPSPPAPAERARLAQPHLQQHHLPSPPVPLRMLITCPALRPLPSGLASAAHLQQQLVLGDPLHGFDQQVRELQPVAQALL